ncbi:SDR family oxidoreductase [Phytoactinopolyspora alkaliphila]|uniref:SDR family oxidoreductase n=1 Tax=Phytoactinopolyspora alkaliphila TaxID=1783498 RepID=A0A6N9YSN9_9ACTN|nr:SDR family oxidoreductase [Phytoactinopolyspora alkaliphila]NED97819.1 SDR family oxidoreductase [Phytoactinopolyspora alkaliphila]
MSVLDQFSLTGKVAVVTGGTGLYGTPFATALAEAGAHVIVTSRHAETARQGAAELREHGGSASGEQLDLADEASISAFHQTVLDAHGRIDVLVNNAVHRAGGTLAGTSAADWDATSAVNSRGLFLVTQAVAATMTEQRAGSIVNIGSIYGLVGPDFPMYEGTDKTSPLFYAYDKAGMGGFTRYLASALGRHGVRVNCLCPGGLYSGQKQTFVDAYSARVPLGRMATESDVTGALVFLASDASAYVTGVALPVDGGWTAR